MAVTPVPSLAVEFVDVERGAAMLDRDARSRLGMSGPDFIKRYRAGELDEFDPDTVFDVALLLPFAGEPLIGQKEP